MNISDETDLAQRLRSRLLRDEPSTPVSATAVTAAGRKKVHRRATALVSATAVALVAVFAVGTSAVQMRTNADDRPQPAQSPNGFSPDQFVATLGAVVTGRPTGPSAGRTAGSAAGSVAGSWVLDGVVAQSTAPGGRKLLGDERADADEWEATFSAGDDRKLEVRLIYAQPVDDTDLSSQRTDCLKTLSLGYADTCEVEASPTGGVLKAVQRATCDEGGNWVVRVGNTAPLQGNIAANRQWYLQQVVDFRPDGLIVTVSEIVRAADSTTGGRLELETIKSLTSLATDPDLWFPLPGQPATTIAPPPGPGLTSGLGR